MLSQRCTIPEITGKHGTRERLMMAGEELMGMRGLSSVPLEEIANHAQQRNKYAVQYHFSSRDGLAQAIMDVRFQQIEARRKALAETIDPTDVQAIFTALIYPLAEQTDEAGRHTFARFLLQFITRDEPLEQIMHPIATAHSTSPTVALFEMACRAIAAQPLDLMRRIQLFLPVPLRLLAEQDGGPVIPDELPHVIRMITAALSVDTAPPR